MIRRRRGAGIGALVALLAAIATTAAAQGATPSPDNSRVPPLPSVTASGSGVFTFAPGSVGPDRQVLRNGLDTQGGGSELLIWKLSAYVKGGDSKWYLYTGADPWPWLEVGADPSAVAIPTLPDPVPVTLVSRLGWTQPGQTVAQAGAGITTVYVDGGAGAALAGVVCTVVAAATDCTAPVPALTAGLHAITISYKPTATSLETPRSNGLRVTVTVSLTPIGLGLRETVTTRRPAAR